MRSYFSHLNTARLKEMKNTKMKRKLEKLTELESAKTPQDRKIIIDKYKILLSEDILEIEAKYRNIKSKYIPEAGYNIEKTLRVTPSELKVLNEQITRLNITMSMLVSRCVNDYMRDLESGNLDFKCKSYLDFSENDNAREVLSVRTGFRLSTRHYEFLKTESENRLMKLSELIRNILRLYV